MPDTQKKFSAARIMTALAALFLVASVAMFEISSSGPSSGQSKESGKSPKDNDADVYEMLELFGKAFEITRDRYVDEVGNKELVESAIDGMLSKRDPHSGYLNNDDFRDMNEHTSGEFGGLGIEVTMDKGVVKVISPMDDTPAAKAGVEPGDLITHIGGEQVYGLTLQEAIKKMKGRPGTKVVLKIFREGKEPFDVTIVRDVIKVDAVKYRVKGEDDGAKVGYIRLSTFNENTKDEMARAIAKIRRDDPKVAGFVLDLRNNTGGLLDQAVQVSDAFLKQGEIVSIMSRQESASRVFFATEGDLIDDMPLVVIINGASASAAEIVAGALQDHRRAVVIGTKSYGKGSVQTLVPLGDGALKITTARYYTPSGRSIQADGIEPDIEINRAKIEEVKEDRLFSEETLTNALKNDTGGAKKPKDAKQSEQDKKDENDYQLMRAVDMVKGLVIYEQKNRERPKTKDAAAKPKAEKKRAAAGKPDAKPEATPAGKAPAKR
ncbi:MAG: S41 family peptidase [Rickettsiales bacterium]|jgi:carboxyl-terminal processing protease|nr:S41 family peptidase [Rickettsiales bacterium]